MTWFADLSTYTDPSSVLIPHNSHLHGTTRTLYWIVFELFGTHYEIIRALAAATVILSAGLFFAYAKRRVGVIAALVPAILLLVFGSAWQHVVGPIGLTVVGSAAAGIAALLALDRNDRRGDLMACGFVCLSVFTFTVGLGYLVGVAISVLLRSDRLRRAWIFLIPLILYTAWYFWSQQFDQTRTDGLISQNFDNILPFLAQSLAVDGGALSGVNVPFSRFGEVAQISTAPASSLGWIVAGAFVVALLWRIKRGNVPSGIYVGLGVVGTYWVAAALADPVLFDTQADATRYVYPGSIGLLLVAVGMGAGVRINRAVAVTALAVAIFSIAMNLVFLRDGAAFLRDFSTTTKVNFAMLDLAATSDRGDAAVDDPIVPRESDRPSPSYLNYGLPAEDYLASAAEYGSPAFTLDEVRDQSAIRRQEADAALIDTYGIGIAAGETPASRSGCKDSDRSQPTIDLPPEGSASTSPAG